MKKLKANIHERYLQHYEIKSLVQKNYTASLQSKNIKIYVYRAIILPVVLSSSSVMC